MKKTKQQKYAESMRYVGVHTLSGVINKELPTKLDTSLTRNCIKSQAVKKVKGTDSKQTYLQINLNKSTGTNQLITRFSEFNQKLNQLLEDIGVKREEFKVTRIDFCINSLEQGGFEEYKKLHKALLCCVAEKYGVVNAYSTSDMWTNNSLNTAVKADYMEVENYDKGAESQHKDIFTNRLELRSKRYISEDLKEEFYKKWVNRLNNSVEYYELVQQRYNAELEYRYKQDLLLPKSQRKYSCLSNFLLNNKDCIFTKRQLVDLLERFEEVKNAENKATNFLAEHEVEFYSKSNLKFMIKSIKKQMKNYFKS